MAILTESAPPNFNSIDAHRLDKKEGGVAILFSDLFQCKPVLFRNAAAVLECSHVLLPIVQRLQSILFFLDEFSELLSIIFMEYDGLTISGGFYIFHDNPNEHNAKELSLDPPMKGSSFVTDIDAALSDHLCIFLETLYRS